MSKLEFAADVIGSIAWPLVALVAVFILRSPIRGWLKRQPKKVKASATGVEIEWDTAASEVDSNLDAADPPVAEADRTDSGNLANAEPGEVNQAGSARSIDSNSTASRSLLAAMVRYQLAENQPWDVHSSDFTEWQSLQLLRLLNARRTLSQELASVAEDSPVGAIAAGSVRLESALRGLLETHGEPPRRPAGMRQLAARARSMGLIDSATANAIRGLSEMRSIALHDAKPITVQQAFEFLTLADRAMTAIDAVPPPPPRLFDDIPLPDPADDAKDAS